MKEPQIGIDHYGASAPGEVVLRILDSMCLPTTAAALRLCGRDAEAKKETDSLERNDLVTLTKTGDIAVVTINNPPVNALSPGVPEGVLRLVEAANADPEVRAIIVIGAGNTFVAGPD